MKLRTEDDEKQYPAFKWPPPHKRAVVLDIGEDHWVRGTILPSIYPQELTIPLDGNAVAARRSVTFEQELDLSGP